MAEPLGSLEASEECYYLLEAPAASTHAPPTPGTWPQPSPPDVRRQEHTMATIHLPLEPLVAAILCAYAAAGCPHPYGHYVAIDPEADEQMGRVICPTAARVGDGYPDNVRGDINIPVHDFVDLTVDLPATGTGQEEDPARWILDALLDGIALPPRGPVGEGAYAYYDVEYYLYDEDEGDDADAEDDDED
jgi:hypothetical protein